MTTDVTRRELDEAVDENFVDPAFTTLGNRKAHQHQQWVFDRLPLNDIQRADLVKRVLDEMVEDTIINLDADDGDDEELVRINLLKRRK